MTGFAIVLFALLLFAVEAIYHRMKWDEMKKCGHAWLYIGIMAVAIVVQIVYRHL